MRPAAPVWQVASIGRGAFDPLGRRCFPSFQTNLTRGNIFMRLLLIMIGLMLVGLSTVSTNAQGDNVNVYMCVDNVGCSHAKTSGNLSAQEAELVLGQERPSEASSVVCGETFCVWTDLTEEELNSLYNSDRETALPPPSDQPDRTEIEVDFEPAEPIDLFDDLTDPNNTAYPTIFCDATRCKRRPTLLTRQEAEFVLGKDAPDGSYYLRCEQNGGCRWELRTGDDDPVATACEDPRSGLWNTPPGTFSGTCPAFLRSFFPNFNRFTSDRVNFPSPLTMRRWILQNEPSFDFTGTSFDQPSVCEHRMIVQEEGSRFIYNLNLIGADQITIRMEINARGELNCDLNVEFEAQRVDD